MLISLFDRVENIIGKGENAGYQHFLLSPQCFQKLFPQSRLKSGLCGKDLNKLNLSQMINFRCFQNYRVCRAQYRM